MDSLDPSVILPDTDVRTTIEAQIARGWQTKRIVREMGVPRATVKMLRSLLRRKGSLPPRARVMRMGAEIHKGR